ncbi:MAG: GntR family transcriptional regulator [Pirellulaceae bacterium]
MFFEIDVSNGVPVYEQGARQIKFAIADGAFEPGQLIPSVRELARELAINPNTVARSYRDLQDQQVIESVRGTGLAVTKSAPTTCRSDRIRVAREHIKNAIGQALRSRLSQDEVLEIVQEELKRVQQN